MKLTVHASRSRPVNSNKVDMPRLAWSQPCKEIARHFQKMEGVLNGYVTNPNPTPTLTPNRNPNSNPNQINEILEFDQITKCQFGRWKLVKTQWRPSIWLQR
jgi:hypothetical protein